MSMDYKLTSYGIKLGHPVLTYPDHRNRANIIKHFAFISCKGKGYKHSKNDECNAYLYFLKESNEESDAIFVVKEDRKTHAVMNYFFLFGTDQHAKYEQYIDLFRNEKPVFLHVDDTEKPTYGYFSTTVDEPIGEFEGKAAFGYVIEDGG